MTNLDKQILKKIKDLKPRAKWKFLLKNYLIWFFAIVFLIFASFAFAWLLYLVVNNDWEYSKILAGSFWNFWLSSFPHIFLIFTVFFLAISYWTFKRTEKGYRIQKKHLMIFNGLIILFLGFLFCFFGLGNTIDGVDLEQSRFFNQRKVIWLNAEKGFLAGEVTKADKDNLRLMDFEGKIWIIDIKSAHVTPYLEDGVKILGVKTSENTFRAKEILPWNRTFLFEKSFSDED